MNAKKSVNSFGALRTVAIALAAGAIGLSAHAHVTVSPTQSKLGKQETYTFTVPTEGSVATVAVEVDVPPGVTIISVGGDPANHSLKKDGDRVATVSWKVNIPPGGGEQLTLVAKNPTQATRRLQWNAHQIFADGTRSDWVEAPPAKPAPLTRLTPAEL